jgi:hypothetical protein
MRKDEGRGREKRKVYLLEFGLCLRHSVFSFIKLRRWFGKACCGGL